MPEQLDPQRLAAERAWIAAYPALITSGLVAKGLIALGSPLHLDAKAGIALRLLVPLLVLVSSAGFARGDRWAGRVVLAWAALATALGLLVARGGVMALLGAVILFALYRVRPGADAVAAPRHLRWVIPAALVGVIDVVLPLSLGAVSPTRVEDVARVTSFVSADLEPDDAWRGGAATLTPRDGLLVLEGVALVSGQQVAIDPGRRALLIGDAVFRGKPLTGTSTGLEVSRRFGRVRGRVVVLRTAPDALQVSFEGLEVDCQRARTRLVLRRERGAPALPEPPERE